MMFYKYHYKKEEEEKKEKKEKGFLQKLKGISTYKITLSFLIAVLLGLFFLIFLEIQKGKRNNAQTVIQNQILTKNSLIKQKQHIAMKL